MDADALAALLRAGDAGAFARALAAAPDRATAVLADGGDLLMLAAALGREDAVAALLEHGADAARRDAAGRSAADHARAGGHAALAQRLETGVSADRDLR